VLSMTYASLFYLATLLFLGGLGYRIYTYWNTPAPLKIPTMPAPTTHRGVAFRIFREVAFFESLFKSNKWIWIFGYIFHVAMALVVLRHFRYFQEPVWGIIALIQPIGMYAGFAMMAGLAALLFRRFAVDRVRYISRPSDYLMLVLLMAIVASGYGMQYVERVDILAVKAFMLGLMRFEVLPLPSNPYLLVHLGLVSFLMIIFPISKLLHAPGVFFSPTRNQVDNAREKRHLAPWAAKLDEGRDR